MFTKMKKINSCAVLGPMSNYSNTYSLLGHTLEQPCSTCGQLAKCGQKGHFVRPNAPLPQKKVETHFCLVNSYSLKNETHLAKCTLVLVFCHFWSSSYSINHNNDIYYFINLYSHVQQKKLGSLILSRISTEIR